jgi:RinA family phage transcriptional activator
MERVAEAIRTVFEGLDEDKKRLVQLKYWTKPQTLTWEGIAQQLRISRAQAFRWREQIICEIASHLGWW